MYKKIILLYSGGLDSTVLLYKLLNDNNHVNNSIKCIGFNYGQKHIKELKHAEKICSNININYFIFDLSSIKHLLNSSLTNESINIPEENKNSPNYIEIMKSTIVPNRNMIMLANATLYAICQRYDTVAFAAQKDDASVYPDCRLEFVEQMNKVIKLYSQNKIELITPFINMTKSEVIKLGKELNVPFDLTWSCYKGDNLPCGKCGACVEREYAFNKNV